VSHATRVGNALDSANRSDVANTCIVDLHNERTQGKFSYICNINTKLYSKVSPDNQFVIHADLLSYKRGIATGVAVGKINNAIVSQGEFTFISPHGMPRP